MPSRRPPLILLLIALCLAAVLIFGPLWDLGSGESPMVRDTSLNYAVAVQLGAVTLMTALALVVSMAWASARARRDSHDVEPH